MCLDFRITFKKGKARIEMHNSAKLKDQDPFFQAATPSTSPINTPASVQEKSTLSRIEKTRREAMSLEDVRAPKKLGVDFSKKGITKKGVEKEEEVSDEKMKLILESLQKMGLDEPPSDDEGSIAPKESTIPRASSTSSSTDSKKVKEKLILHLILQMLRSSVPEANPSSGCLIFLSIEVMNPALKK